MLNAHHLVIQQVLVHAECGFYIIAHLVINMVTPLGTTAHRNQPTIQMQLGQPVSVYTIIPHECARSTIIECTRVVGGCCVCGACSALD